MRNKDFVLTAFRCELIIAEGWLCFSIITLLTFPTVCRARGKMNNWLRWTVDWSGAYWPTDYSWFPIKHPNVIKSPIRIIGGKLSRSQRFVSLSSTRLTDWNVSNMWTCGEKNIVCYFFARGECKWSLNRFNLPFSFISKLSKINSRQISLSDFQEAIIVYGIPAHSVFLFIFLSDARMNEQTVGGQHNRVSREQSRLQR